MTDADAGPRVVLAGSVGSSRRTLAALIRHHVPIAGVLGLDPSLEARVSGFSRLDDLAASVGAPFRTFRSINEPDIVETVRGWAPDLLFVVGLSQIVAPELLKVAPLGAVGFHPTALPEGRGRAPLAWLIYDGRPGAATFFLMDEGVDSGDIVAQEPYPVGAADYAAEVYARMEEAIDGALDRWLPNLKRGAIRGIPQDAAKATYNAGRWTEDGCIDWAQPAPEIERLVRTAARPHPGAYTYAAGCKLIVWRARALSISRWRGIVGRIVEAASGDQWIVQTGDGSLVLEETEAVTDGSGSPPRLRVGLKLGYGGQDELHALRRRVEELERRLDDLEGKNRP